MSIFMGAVPFALVAFSRAHELPGLFLFLLVEEAGAPQLLPCSLYASA